LPILPQCSAEGYYATKPAIAEIACYATVVMDAWPALLLVSGASAVRGVAPAVLAGDCAEMGTIASGDGSV
jgi:hypothetical protein